MNDERVFTLRMPSERPFRILQATDLHLMGLPTDDLTFSRLGDAVRRLRPDLVFLTGDQAMSPDSVRLYGTLATFMESLGVPWTFVFGNHDAEAGVTREALVRAVEGARRLHFTAFDGASDFAIRLVDAAGSCPWVLAGLDTGIDRFYDLPQGRTWGYDGVKPHQTEWLRDVVRRLASKTGHDVPVLLFQHIPPWEAGRFDAPGATGFDGVVNEAVCCPPQDVGYAATMRDIGVRGVFFGHDHLNDFTFVRDGIRYTYGRCSGHYDYAMPGFAKGVRLIEAASDGTFASRVVLYQASY